MLQPMPVETHLQDYQVPDYFIDTVDLQFTLNEDFTHVKSYLSLQVNPTRTSTHNDLILKGEELELISIVLNEKILSKEEFKLTADSLTLFNVPNQFTLVIETHIKPQQNTKLSGLYKSSGNFCTQCEAEGFRRITYFLDRPDVMARYTTTIIADQQRYPVLLSNGNLIHSKKLDKGKHLAKWEDPFKKPSYLFALVAGDLEWIEDFFTTQSGRHVTLRIYVEKGQVDKCAHAMQAVKKAMRWDEQTFGREYDLDIYMIVAVSDFNMGAMENKGLNIFNTKYILAKEETATDIDFVQVESVIAHEYFHNWTGNRITCRDWFQLSLKEGLTIFRDQSFTADTTSKIVARINDVNELRNTQFPEDAGPLAHPVRPESYVEINNFYTATIYNKGSEVIRMMQTILGEKLFRAGMDLYFRRHDGQAVTIEDFVRCMEKVSDIDLMQFRLWYSQAGTPVLEVMDQYNAQEKIYTLKIKQSCPATPDQPIKQAFHIPIKIGLLDESGKELLQAQIQLKETQKEFHFENVSVKPIPSLLRHFSAPVKVHYNYPPAALQLLFKHDTDLFNRWEAGQKYAVNIILQLMRDFKEEKIIEFPAGFLEVFRHHLKTLQEDKLLLAEMLTLPSELYIAEQMDVIDIEAIHQAREFMLLEIAKHLKQDFKTIYEQNSQTKASGLFTMEEMGQRQLKNISLAYLMYLGEEEIYENFAMRQFKESLTSNMTNTLGALRCLTNTDCVQRELALSAFYQQWQHDTLVIDKWFNLQASSKLPHTLENVKNLLQHPAFDIKNPNKVYTLIGAFGRNLLCLHQATGEGYEFLADSVLRLDPLNSQVAARMVKPLMDWKRYDKSRQQLMRQQLERIAKTPLLSKDVNELVTKSLE